jgi:hypothetical protein
VQNFPLGVQNFSLVVKMGNLVWGYWVEVREWAAGAGNGVSCGSFREICDVPSVRYARNLVGHSDFHRWAPT